MAEEYRRPTQRPARNRRKNRPAVPPIFSLKIFRQIAASALLLTTVCILRYIPPANTVITKAFNYQFDTSGITESLARLLQTTENTKEGSLNENTQTDTNPGN